MVRELYHGTACVKYLSLTNILFQSVKLVFIIFGKKVNASVAGDLLKIEKAFRKIGTLGQDGTIAKAFRVMLIKIALSVFTLS